MISISKIILLQVFNFELVPIVILLGHKIHNVDDGFNTTVNESIKSIALFKKRRKIKPTAPLRTELATNDRRKRSNRV